jgi:hypothetical protein
MESKGISILEYLLSAHAGAAAETTENDVTNDETH